MSFGAGQDILEQRAAQLARPLTERRTDAVLDLLFVVAGGGGRFALEARAVRHVRRDEPLSRLPVGAGALVAVAIVAGEAVPVADLGWLLDAADARRDRPFLVVLEGGTGPVGFLVDEVLDVAAVHRDDLGTLASTAKGPSAPHRLITPDGAVVLDTEPLLADGRLVVAESSTQQTPLHHPQPPQGAP
jgi:chemotaxis signal transduction protein